MTQPRRGDIIIERPIQLIGNPERVILFSLTHPHLGFSSIKKMMIAKVVLIKQSCLRIGGLVFVFT